MSGELTSKSYLSAKTIITLEFHSFLSVSENGTRTRQCQKTSEKFQLYLLDGSKSHALLQRKASLPQSWLDRGYP